MDTNHLFVTTLRYQAGIPQFTLRQAAALHALHAFAKLKENDQAGKYTWYEFALVEIKRAYIALGELCKGSDGFYKYEIVISDGADISAGITDWPVKHAIGVVFPGMREVLLGSQTKDYETALRDYWLDQEAGVKNPHPLPDLKDYTY